MANLKQPMYGQYDQQLGQNGQQGGFGNLGGPPIQGRMEQNGPTMDIPNNAFLPMSGGGMPGPTQHANPGDWVPPPMAPGEPVRGPGPGPWIPPPLPVGGDGFGPRIENPIEPPTIPPPDVRKRQWQDYRANTLLGQGGHSLRQQWRRDMGYR